MINVKDVENLTKAYLHSFNTALNETHNPSLAGQAAAKVNAYDTERTERPI